MDPPLATLCSEVPPLGEYGRDAGSSDGLVESPTPCYLGAPFWARVFDPARQEFAQCPEHGHARGAAGPQEEAAVAVGAGSTEKFWRNGTRGAHVNGRLGNCDVVLFFSCLGEFTCPPPRN